MGEAQFRMLVSAWLESFKNELLASGDYTREELEAGCTPDLEFFEDVEWDEVLGGKAFDNDMQAAVYLRSMLPNELVMSCDAYVIDECRDDDEPDLGYMLRVSMRDMFRIFLQTEFEKKFVDNGESVL